jgi:translation initiation factor 2B subunit (eIF-2B alpha/beta/delta family)
MSDSLPLAVQETVDAIRDDRQSGAFHLSRRAAEAFRTLACHEQIDPTMFCEQVEALGRRLTESQPSMAPMRVLAGRTRIACLRAQPSMRSRAVLQVVDDFLAQLAAATQKISSFAQELIPERGAVLTISASATVLQALDAAHRAGRSFHVICTESRPQNEGVSFARSLAKEGIPVTLILDAAVAEAVPGATVLVGADACTPAGLINKVGTHTLALLADRFGSPCYALCGQEKLLPESWARGITIADQPATEILPEPAPGVTVINRYFDCTPLALFTGLVTDMGLLRPDEVLDILSRQERVLPVETRPQL